MLSAVAIQDNPEVSEVSTNVEAEAALLGAILIGNGLIDRVSEIVTQEDFSIQLHGQIFCAVLREHLLGHPVSPTTIKPFFDGNEQIAQLGGTSYLARLTADGQGLLAPFELAKQIAELAARRRLSAGMTAIIESCADYAKPLADIIAEAEAHLTVRTGEAIHQPSGSDCFDEMFECYREGTSGLRSSVIGSLDDLMGAVQPKELIIVAARPGMGKTALALSYSIGAAHAGHGVLFVSLEMSSRELGARMAADMCFDGEGGVPYATVQSGKFNDWQKRRIIAARNKMADLPFRVVDVGSLAISKLAMIVRRNARRMEAKGQKLELVVVDYLQLLSPDTRGRSSYEAVSEVSKGLKALAKDQGLVVMALAQLSREVEKRPDKRPILADLRDSGQIEQDADAVLFLLREEYYLRQIEPEESSPKYLGWRDMLDRHAGQIEFILAKRRSGTTGRALGKFFGSYQAVRG